MEILGGEIMKEFDKSSGQDKRQKIDECEAMEGAILFDGFEDAIVGVGTVFAHPVVIYSWKKCIEILEKGGLSYEDAVEYMEFNVTGAYLGESTPVVLRDDLMKDLASD
jgi:hypothetical protein